MKNLTCDAGLRKLWAGKIPSFSQHGPSSVLMGCDSSVGPQDRVCQLPSCSLVCCMVGRRGLHPANAVLGTSLHVIDDTTGEQSTT